MSYDYLLQLGVILVSTKLLGIATGRLQLPQVVGALLAGLLLGPAVLGVLQPSDFLNQLAEMGVIVIMFSAGMGTSLRDLKNSGRAGFLVALCGVLVPLGLGAGLMAAFYPGSSPLQALFLGTVLTATSVSITVETLKELGRLSTKVGNTILAAALIDDILGLVCLTVVTSLAGQGVSIVWVLVRILLFFVFAVLAGWCFDKLFFWYDRRVKDRNLHRFPILAFALCLFMAWAAEALFGVADIIGAFAAGLIVAATPKGTYIAEKCAPLSYLLLTPVFFANIGLKVSLPAMSGRVMLFSVLLVLVGILSKVIGCGLGARACGFKLRQCLQTGVGMACRGEVALIVANKGIAMGMIDMDCFGPIIIMVVCCAVLTPVMLKAAFKGEPALDSLEESTLVDRYELGGQMDIVASRLLEANEKNLTGKKTAQK